MPVNVIVLYPKVENYRFDEKYYKEVHMPLVEKKLGPLGLKEWRISKLELSDPSQDCPYGIQADLIFGSANEARAAFRQAGEEVLGDIPNFTNSNATLMIGEIFGTGQGKA